jgi:hypothetical protein
MKILFVREPKGIGPAADGNHCLTFCRGGGQAEGRVNLGRAGSIGRRSISGCGGAGRCNISHGSCDGGGGRAWRRSMK